jgi:hypothetical protein
MSFVNPEQVPPEEPEKYTFSLFMGCLIVDGLLQCGMAFWFQWVVTNLTNLNFNVWLFWLGLTIMFVTLHWYDRHKSAVVLLYELGLLIILSTITAIIT